MEERCSSVSLRALQPKGGEGGAGGRMDGLGMNVCAATQGGGRAAGSNRMVWVYMHALRPQEGEEQAAIRWLG
eukprot:359847-Chlamydomonas_euryale.AAC.2